MTAGHSADLNEVTPRVRPGLEERLRTAGLSWGAPVYLRIFKESSEMEFWMQPKSGGAWKLFHTYRIAAWSGHLGPKLAEGDGQSPEGFYATTRRLLNPNSRFHLSFNIGYPNAFDRAHDRTGSLIMVHGSFVSIGCFAMTDPGIEEIYLLTAAALSQGQSEVPIHVFPFRMTTARMQRAVEEGPEVLVDFWQQLRAGYEAFEASQKPPKMRVRGGRYEVNRS
ncbi:MAG: murein L,D-transpeptidase [Verrucomicrobiales bacterium]|nr:murein L,D-transpeptidase [Verrucomicrobiales bacterium]